MQHTTNEKILLTNFRASGKSEKNIILSVAELEAISTKAQRDSREKHTITCILPNGRLYIRKYIEEEKHYRLKCLHPQGEDIVLKRPDAVSYLGTCIEVIRS